MKRLVLAGIGALAAVTMISLANAADLSNRAMPAKAPAYVQTYNWTGGYVGINGGGGWGRSDVSAPFTSGGFNTSGGVVGGTLGYNWQMNQTVFGLEGDVDWSNISGNAACGIGLNCQTRNDWLGTARGRIGYTFDRFLPFVTGGAAFGDIKNSVTGLGSSTATKAGWTVGAGLEAAISGPWTAKIEYLYADLGRGSSLLGSTTRFDTNLMRAGLNYRF